MKNTTKEKRSIAVLAVGIAVALLFGCFGNLTGVFMSADNIAHAEEPKIELIAKFSTYYGDSKQNRKDNIALACRKIDGTVLNPEDEFSFNGAVGRRTEANGFKTAYIIRDGEFVEGTGGGVCQVSTTIYNCALLANLAITCVYPHSLPVAYVAPSFDAMVSSVSDLRFVNTLSTPLTIKMRADEKCAYAEIYGVREADIRRRSEVISTIPYPTQYQEVSSIPVGEEKIDTYGKNGIKSVGYLDFFKNGQVVKSVKIRNDTYMPQKQIIFKGVKPQENNVDNSDILNN
ncbi:MAG: VanW family protein [Clostridia bacterium]